MTQRSLCARPQGPPAPHPPGRLRGPTVSPCSEVRLSDYGVLLVRAPENALFGGGPVLPEHGESQAKSGGPCFKQAGPRIQLHFLKRPHGFGKDSQSPRDDMTSDRGENAEPVSSTLGSQAACDHGFPVCGNAHVSVSQGDQGGAEF